MSDRDHIRASALRVTERDLVVELEDGSEHSLPIALFPILSDATVEERSHFELIGGALDFIGPCWTSTSPRSA
jgi:hypothetical protein